jgi:hypothetical protein
MQMTCYSFTSINLRLALDIFSLPKLMKHFETTVTFIFELIFM